MLQGEGTVSIMCDTQKETIEERKNRLLSIHSNYELIWFKNRNMDPFFENGPFDPPESFNKIKDKDNHETDYETDHETDYETDYESDYEIDYEINYETDHGTDYDLEKSSHEKNWLIFENELNKYDKSDRTRYEIIDIFTKKELLIDPLLTKITKIREFIMDYDESRINSNLIKQYIEENNIHFPGAYKSKLSRNGIIDLIKKHNKGDIQRYIDDDFYQHDSLNSFHHHLLDPNYEPDINETYRLFTEAILLDDFMTIKWIVDYANESFIKDCHEIPLFRSLGYHFGDEYPIDLVIILPVNNLSIRLKILDYLISKGYGDSFNLCENHSSWVGHDEVFGRFSDYGLYHKHSSLLMRIITYNLTRNDLYVTIGAIDGLLLRKLKAISIADVSEIRYIDETIDKILSMDQSYFILNPDTIEYNCELFEDITISLIMLLDLPLLKRVLSKLSVNFSDFANSVSYTQAVLKKVVNNYIFDLMRGNNDNMTVLTRILKYLNSMDLICLGDLLDSDTHEYGKIFLNPSFGYENYGKGSHKKKMISNLGVQFENSKLNHILKGMGITVEGCCNENFRYYRGKKYRKCEPNAICTICKDMIEVKVKSDKNDATITHYEALYVVCFNCQKKFHPLCLEETAKLNKGKCPHCKFFI